MKLSAVLALLLLLAGCQNKPATGPAASGTAPNAEGAANSADLPQHKDIVVLTPSAVERVKTVLASQNAEYLRVMVTETGGYGLNVVTQPDPQDDFLGSSGGVQIVVDRKSSEVLP